MHTYTMCSFADSGSPPVRGKFELSSLFFSARSSWPCFRFIELRSYFFVLTRVSSHLFYYARCSLPCFLLTSLHTLFFTHVLSPQLFGFSLFRKKQLLKIMHYFRLHPLRLQFSVFTVVSVLVGFLFSFVFVFFFSFACFFVFSICFIFSFTFWGKSII